MRRLKITLCFFAVCLLELFSISVKAEIKLPRLIGNGMVLQRNIPLNIWGWATPSENIRVVFLGKIYESKADSLGNWLIKLPAIKAGGPYKMKVNSIEIDNILIGDVWLCSGQSNMEYPMSRLTDKYADVIAHCSNNNIRQFKIPTIYNFSKPLVDYPSGKWITVNSQSILDYSAIAYFFAEELYQKYHVPIGIINASLGGSPIEAWMSVDALKYFPKDLDEAKKFADTSFVKKLQEDEQKAILSWYFLMNKKDKGLQSKHRWKNTDFDDSSWPTTKIPGFLTYKKFKMSNGAMWFRRTIEIDKSMCNKRAHLLMGRIVDADSVFINGCCVGTTSYQYPQRNYHVPANILKPGKNTIVVRLISNIGIGGFVPDKPYKLIVDQDTINLAGTWHYQLGCEMPPTPGQTFVRWKATGLYNAMIAPSNYYRIKGAVWYQGESNTGNYKDYQKLLTNLINDWRIKRGHEKFPFIIAQLPNFMSQKDQPSESVWASLRFEQLETYKTLDNIAMTVNIDLGEWNDIHPQNKLDVSKRLALAAEKLVYGDKKVVASGPIFQSMKIKGTKIELSFSHCGSGLTTNDGKALNYFAISGANKKFVWAKAEIRKNKIFVWNDKIKNPVAVRYAWADNPDGANLYNKEGLPASPFKTDTIYIK